MENNRTEGMTALTEEELKKVCGGLCGDYTYICARDNANFGENGQPPIKLKDNKSDLNPR